MKQILFLFHVIICCGVAQAQVQFGVKAGGNISSQRSSYGAGNKARAGFQAGIFSDISIDKKFSVRPELIYAIKGYAFTATQFSTSGTMGFRYINFPVLVGYRPTKELELLAGPELGWLLGVNAHSSGQNNDVTRLYKRKFDLGLIAGALYAFTDKFAADLRIIYGIQALFNGLATDQYGNDLGTVKDRYNLSLQLGVNYTFH